MSAKKTLPEKTNNSPAEKSQKKNAQNEQRITDASAVNAALEEWLKKNPVPDKDFIARETSEKKRHISRRIANNMAIDDVIDLHGQTQDEAWASLENFVDKCRRSGYRKILIIHGKGNHSQAEGGILKTLVGKFVALSSSLGISGHPENKDGGSGATWAIIRR